MKHKKDKKCRVVISKNYKSIELNELLAGDILLFLHGNKLTEWHGRNRKKKFGRSTKPPYHAAIVYSVVQMIDGKPDVFILDPEISTSLSFLKEYLTKTSTRVDIVRFKATRVQRRKIQKKIKDIAFKEGLYDWKGYFAFASQMPFLGWLKIIKPSKKTFFCSDAVVHAVQKSTNIRVSPRGSNYTAPVDIQLYGLQYHKLYTLKKQGEYYGV